MDSDRLHFHLGSELNIFHIHLLPYFVSFCVLSFPTS